MAIPYPGFGVIINIVSKEDITYSVTIGDIPHCTCPDLTKMSSHGLWKKRKWMYCKHLYYVFWFLCKVDYESDKFIHIPTTRSCDYLNLLVLYSVSSIASFLLSHMYKNVTKWHVLVWVFIIKNLWTEVFKMIHGNRPPLFVLHLKCLLFAICNLQYQI